MEFRKTVTTTLLCKTLKETHMERTDFWTMWEKARVRRYEKLTFKHVYYMYIICKIDDQCKFNA